MPCFLKSEDGIFRTAKEFERRKNELVFGQLIRRYSYGMTASEESYYVVGDKARLYDTRTGLEVEPLEVLVWKDGWSFDGTNLDALPDEVLREHFNII